MYKLYAGEVVHAECYLLTEAKESVRESVTFHVCPGPERIVDND